MFDLAIIHLCPLHVLLISVWYWWYLFANRNYNILCISLGNSSAVAQIMRECLIPSKMRTSLARKNVFMVTLCYISMQSFCLCPFEKFAHIWRVWSFATDRRLLSNYSIKALLEYQPSLWPPESSFEKRKRDPLISTKNNSFKKLIKTLL